MTIRTLLIANRGEIAIRIARAATRLGIQTVSVYSKDDAHSLHVRRTDTSFALPGVGPRAYLDINQMINAAKASKCDAIHPGYGFLSENAEFARACLAADLRFVGPRPEVLELFGDKAQAKSLAKRLGVPVLDGAFAAVSLAEAQDFFRALSSRNRDGAPQIIIKAIAGGGGRGMRVVKSMDDLPEAYARCRSEAKAAFGNGDVYLERYLPRARHIEVQIVGDGTGAVTHFGERECTVQRRHQKLIEIAPSPNLSGDLRQRLTDAAVAMAKEARYASLGTFEFLVDAEHSGEFVFIEANARLQVEHTVTEEIYGIDLVTTQLKLAGGATLSELQLSQDQVPAPKGMSIQLRVNLETMQVDGGAKPSGGTLTVFEPPSGPGVRVDSYGYNGYTTAPSFDSLIAKVIVTARTRALAEVAAHAYRALCEFRIAGVDTNLSFLQNIIRHPDFIADRIDTRFIDEHLDALLGGNQPHPRLFVDTTEAPTSARLAGARVDALDPLAVLAHGKQAAVSPSTSAPPAVIEELPGIAYLRAPLQGTIVAIDVQMGQLVRPGQQVMVMESMKMEHVVIAKKGGEVRQISVAVGDAVFEGALLLTVEETFVESKEEISAKTEDLETIRPDLKEVLDRHWRALDAARPDAVTKRHEKNQRTARENIDDLCDPGSFVEYGPLVLAAQRARRTVEELIVKSPADGMVTGVGSINGDLFKDPHSRCAVMSYDYTVFAGTQGARNHIKTDRMLRVAEEGRMPVVLFAEGGGGRPGDTESSGDAGGTRTFAHFAQLSGLVPIVGIVSGRCFAGNASLLGCCDVIIATANSNIGMGGPAMVEGGGLGVFAPEEIGPMSVQVPNGVVDIAVADEAAAVKAAKKYLSYFQGTIDRFDCVDQRRMRRIIPENRLRVYNVREVIETLADSGWVLELRPEFGKGMVTALVRIEGRPVGVIANNPLYLGGAIDADGADKASRFMQVCDAFDIPVLFLCDTPGIMVGPEIEKTALVRHCSRMFVIGANLSVPFFTIVLRKAYGLGAIAMGGGSFKSPMFAVSWPTGEFGGMGLEGAVKLAYRNELAAIDDPVARRKKYDEMVAQLYERGKALNISTIFGMDDTIDPADSRRWVASMLRSVRPTPRPPGKKRPWIDAW